MRNPPAIPISNNPSFDSMCLIAYSCIYGKWTNIGNYRQIIDRILVNVEELKNKVRIPKNPKTKPIP